MNDSPADRSEDADAASSGPADSPAAGGEDGSESVDDAPDYESSGSGMRARDVEVPMRVYKTVTVFSTLIAVVSVVVGFLLLDRATGRAKLPISQVDPVLAVLGIAVILFGAATYAFGTRFRAAGMGSSKTDDDEAADNG